MLVFSATGNLRGAGNVLTQAAFLLIIQEIFANLQQFLQLLQFPGVLWSQGGQLFAERVTKGYHLTVKGLWEHTFIWL